VHGRGRDAAAVKLRASPATMFYSMLLLGEAVVRVVGSIGLFDSLVAACEPFGLAARGAALHVDDFVVPDREDLEAFVATSVGGEPLG
jgi:hypothetical protein